MLMDSSDRCRRHRVHGLDDESIVCREGLQVSMYDPSPKKLDKAMSNAKTAKIRQQEIALFRLQVFLRESWFPRSQAVPSFCSSRYSWR